MIRMEKKRDALLQLHQKDSDLPVGFKRCNFLRSTGKQIIETDFLVNDNLTTFMRFRITELVPATSTNLFVIAYYEAYSRYRPIKLDAGNFKIPLMNNVTTLASIPQDKEIHTILYNDANGDCIFDGTNVGRVFAPLNRSNNIGLGIFGQTQKNNDLRYSENSLVKAEIYCVIGYDKTTGEIIDEYIPCLDRNGTPCMFGKHKWKAYYDLVNNEPFEYELAN